MIKFFVLAIFSIQLLSTNASASRDSVAIFHRPNKVVILLNEKNGAPRLHALMKSLGADQNFVYESYDRNLRIKCARNEEESTCTFAVETGGLGTIGNKRVDALIPAIELNIQNDYSMHFESSMQDKFRVIINSDGLEFVGTKK